MPEREKVMKELSWLILNFPVQKNPIDAADKMCNAINAYCNDALALLKEQEAVKPGVEDDGLPDENRSWWYVCGNCGKAIDPGDTFCRVCGRKVKWDG